MGNLTEGDKKKIIDELRKYEATTTLAQWKSLRGYGKWNYQWCDELMAAKFPEQHGAIRRKKSVGLTIETMGWAIGNRMVGEEPPPNSLYRFENGYDEYARKRHEEGQEKDERGKRETQQKGND